MVGIDEKNRHGGHATKTVVDTKRSLDQQQVHQISFILLIYCLLIARGRGGLYSPLLLELAWLTKALPALAVTENPCTDSQSQSQRWGGQAAGEV